MRPILFLDVDGPLIPFGADGGYPVYPPEPAGNPLLARLDPALGPRLLALGCSLVWATTWQHDANVWISPRLGLPSLPVVDWPDLAEPPHGLHWKTPALVDWAAGRPFAWVDDEIGARDRSWVAAVHPGRALLRHVDHRRGLTDGDFAAVEEWVRG
ncbi:hypothetical protein AB0M28_22685 [Streptomyces sp. NPDC051940]|uniref:hypothetical protein n=1 Tax=Streptomyces sp. NPDC051940 TaxID=3155675 RepID=UPI0034273114